MLGDSERVGCGLVHRVGVEVNGWGQGELDGVVIDHQDGVGRAVRQPADRSGERGIAGLVDELVAGGKPVTGQVERVGRQVNGVAGLGVEGPRGLACRPGRRDRAVHNGLNIREPDAQPQREAQASFQVDRQAGLGVGLGCAVGQDIHIAAGGGDDGIFADLGPGRQIGVGHRDGD